MMKVKNFPQSHLHVSRLKKIKKQKEYLCLLNILRSKIYIQCNLKMNFEHLLLLVMCHQQSFHITIQQLLKSSRGSLFLQEIFHQNSSIKIFIPLDGLHTMHHRNVAYKFHQVSILFLFNTILFYYYF